MSRGLNTFRRPCMLEGKTKSCMNWDCKFYFIILHQPVGFNRIKWKQSLYVLPFESADIYSIHLLGTTLAVLAELGPCYEGPWFSAVDNRSIKTIQIKLKAQKLALDELVNEYQKVAVLTDFCKLSWCCIENSK